MTNNYTFSGQIPGINQIQQIQQMFPQPQGSIYTINSPLDIGNVPIGSTGLSVAICIPENLMYIKSFQNGQPAIMVYRISPFQKESKDVEPATSAAIAADDINARLLALEGKISKLIDGGKFDGLI